MKNLYLLSFLSHFNLLSHELNIINLIVRKCLIEMFLMEWNLKKNCEK